MELWQLEIDILEDAGIIPVVRLAFFGRTKEEAEERLHDHVAYDRMLAMTMKKLASGLRYTARWQQIRLAMVTASGNII